MKIYKKIISFIFILLLNNAIYSSEMIIGEEKIEPGINIIFEGAIKDDVAPSDFFLSESGTDVHLEALINWSNDAPNGSPKGGFIPYLNVEAQVKNKRTKMKKKFSLTPHINISDNFHYAINIKLPGRIDDKYDITFNIFPPREGKLGYHFDWRESYNYPLIQPFSYVYEDLNFKEIALSKRR